MFLYLTLLYVPINHILTLPESPLCNDHKFYLGVQPPVYLAKIISFQGTFPFFIVNVCENHGEGLGCELSVKS